MTAYSEELLAELSARYYLYELFRTLFGNAPTDDVLAAIDSEVTKEAFSLVGTCEDQGGAVSCFLRALETPIPSKAVLRDEYTRAFEGPESLPAPPWESVYVSSKRLLFQESTLKIRDTYRAEGLLAALYPRVADDHLSLELAFLAHLAQRALDACAISDQEALVHALDVSHSFLVDHLAKWVGGFADDIAAWKSDSLYALAAHALVAFVQVDLNNLDQMNVR
ncbi:MAG: molecular chaperone TorD family protein [Raoultibacter sp.]